VSVTLAELAGSLREGLLALAVGAGFQVMGTSSTRSSPSLQVRRAATIRTGRRWGKRFVEDLRIKIQIAGICYVYEYSGET
jgi:hypothetical protein